MIKFKLLFICILFLCIGCTSQPRPYLGSGWVVNKQIKPSYTDIMLLPNGAGGYTFIPIFHSESYILGIEPVIDKWTYSVQRVSVPKIVYQEINMDDWYDGRNSCIDIGKGKRIR